MHAPPVHSQHDETKRMGYAFITFKQSTKRPGERDLRDCDTGKGSVVYVALKAELRAYPGRGISVSEGIRNNTRDGFRLGGKSPRLQSGPRDTRLGPLPEFDVMDLGQSTGPQFYASFLTCSFRVVASIS